jgi:hypothetical protein
MVASAPAREGMLTIRLDTASEKESHVAPGENKTDGRILRARQVVRLCMPGEASYAQWLWQLEDEAKLVSGKPASETLSAREKR